MKNKSNNTIYTRTLIPHQLYIYIAVSLAVNTLTYNGTRLITRKIEHTDLTLPVDHFFPFMPWTVTIYMGCYAFWIVNYIMGCRQEEYEAKHFLCTDCFARIICCFIYLIFPTTKVRPDITGTGFFDEALRLLYRLDAPDNLFPSIHCITSWNCVIAVRKQKQISDWYKDTSVIIAFLVFNSVLTTRQHVIADVVAGVAVSELSYHIVRKTGFLRWYINILDSASDKLKSNKKK